MPLLSQVAPRTRTYDRTRGTVLRVTFDPLHQGEFLGLHVTEPENFNTTESGFGYDLRGSQEIHFDAMSPGGGLDVEIGVGASGTAHGVKASDQYASFWFDSPSNPEVFVKVLDFGGDGFLVFHSSLSDLEYTVTFVVLRTGRSYTFKREAGSVCGLADGSTVRK